MLDKHQRIARYVDISRGVRKRFIGPGKAGATYIDLFCGPGRSRIKGTDRVVDGSALLAWKAAAEGGAPFTEVIVADLRVDLVHAASQRLMKHGAEVKCEVGTAEQTVDQIMKGLDPYGLHFVLLDPYGLAALPFEIVEKLSRLRRVDFLIHFSAQSLQRNLRRAMRARHSALDVFAPCGVAVCAHSNRSDGHAPPGAEAAAKLTLPLDHSTGADHRLLVNVGISKAVAELVRSALNVPRSRRTRWWRSSSRWASST